MGTQKKFMPYKSPFGGKWAIKHSIPHGIGIVVAVSVTVVAFIAVITSRESEIQDTAETEQVVSVVTAIDGDTIDLNGKRVRLHGIDAPEKGQPCSRNGVAYDCGLAATDQLQFILSGERLQCEKKSSDRWGREIAICRVGATDIGRQMVRQGWAVAYREYSTDYVEDELFARDNSLGMWAKEFVIPKDWRSRGAN
jgi:Micrococcal nuclease (thermonuclease) homologs